MRVHTKLAVAISTVLLTAPPSNAESSKEKLCIFAAARKLPALPGLTATASRAKPGPAAMEAAKILASSFADRGGADELNRLDLLSAVQSREIQSALAQGSPQRAAAAIASALAPQITDSSSVEIDIRAAGQPATFNFLCAGTGGGAPLVVSLGMSE